MTNELITTLQEAAERWHAGDLSDRAFALTVALELGGVGEPYPGHLDRLREALVAEQRPQPRPEGWERDPHSIYGIERSRGRLVYERIAYARATGGEVVSLRGDGVGVQDGGVAMTVMVADLEHVIREGRRANASRSHGKDGATL